MSTRAAAGVIAGLLIAVGLIVGLVPHHVPLDFRSGDGATSLSCGSAFSPDHSGVLSANFGSDISAAYAGKGADGGTDYAAKCSDALQTPRIAALLLLAAGGLGGLFLLLTSMSKPRPAQVVDQA